MSDFQTYNSTDTDSPRLTIEELDKTLDELAWKCSNCGATNSPFRLMCECESQFTYNMLTGEFRWHDANTQ